eukprot:11680819-Ditylum_brightwellii.AAC.1
MLENRDYHRKPLEDCTCMVSVPSRHSEAHWIPSLRKYLNLIDCAIEVDNAYNPAVQRKNDDYIMDIISSGNNFIQTYASRWQNIRSSVLTGSNVSME